MPIALAPHMAKINKSHIREAVSFAINNIPEVDRTTLEEFLELINSTDTSGSISYMQLIGKMHLALTYNPSACPHSLLILVNLLENRPLTSDRHSTTSPAISNVPDLAWSRQSPTSPELLIDYSLLDDKVSPWSCGPG